MSTIKSEKQEQNETISFDERSKILSYICDAEEETTTTTDESYDNTPAADTIEGDYEFW